MKIFFLKAMVITAVTIGIILMTRLVLEDNTSNSEKLVQAIQYTDFSLDEVDLNVWGEYLPKYLSPEEMDTLVNGLANNLEITDYRIHREESQSKRTCTIEKAVTDGSTKVQLTEIIEEVEDATYEARNYIVVTIKLKNKGYSIAHFEHIVKNYFKKIGVEPVTHLTVSASKAGRISDDIALLTMTQLVQVLEGEVVTDFKDQGICSLYGYSEAVDDYVIANGKKINMDLAITYNETDQRTYLYGAIPVITFEY